MNPYWPQVPTSRGSNQPKRYYRSREPIKPRMKCCERSILQSEVLHTTLVRSFRFQHEGCQTDPHHVREMGSDLFIILVESLFQNDQFCLIKCRQECETKSAIKRYQTGVNPRPHDRQIEPLPSRLLCCYTHTLLVVYNLTNSGQFTTCENY